MIKADNALRINKWMFVVTALLLYFSSELFSQKVNSNLYFNAGLGVNLNFHSANFLSINPSEDKWDGFKSGYGFGEFLYAGIEYRLPKKLFSKEIRGRLNLAYSNLSADLTEEDFIGHIITGNSYTNGTSIHKIESSISALIVEPQFLIYPFDDLPIGTFAGFQIGFPLKMYYLQEERISNPDYGTFENGLRVRGQSDGEIPLPSSLYFALSIGARYELYKFDNLTILPELKFNIGLTNLTSNLEWKPSSITISAVIQFNPSVSKRLPPPSLPPPPLAPAPPKPDAPELVLRAFYKGNEIRNDDIIKVKVVDSLFVTNYFVSPIIFFGENESVINEKATKPLSQEDAQNLSIKAVKNYLLKNPDAGVTIISSSLINEPKEVTKNRVDEVIGKLDVEKARIKQKNIVKKNNLKYPELSDENRFIEFDIGNINKGLIIPGDTLLKSFYEKTDIEIEPIIKSDDENDFAGEMNIGNANKIELNRVRQIYNLNDFIKSENLKHGIPIQINAAIIDKSSREASAKINLYLVAEPVEKVVIENSVSREGESYSEYILGFCEFGKFNFYSINQYALEFAKKAVRDGKTIEILPLTDSLGTIDYNKNLANKRGEAALKLLSINKNNSNVIIPDKYFFSNSTPEGRLLNRSVLVRIY